MPDSQEYEDPAFDDEKVFNAGFSAGRKWAEEGQADEEELKTLDRLWRDADCSEVGLLDAKDGSDFATTEAFSDWLYFGMHPKDRKNSDDAEAFWEDVLKGDSTYTSTIPFCISFVKGALEAWEQRKSSKAKKPRGRPKKGR